MKRTLLCLTASLFAVLAGCDAPREPTAQVIGAEEEGCGNWVLAPDGESCTCGDLEAGLDDSVTVNASAQRPKVRTMVERPADQVVVTLYTNPKTCAPCKALEAQWPDVEAGFFVCNGQPVIYQVNVGYNPAGGIPTITIVGGGHNEIVSGRNAIVNALANVYACD